MMEEVSNKTSTGRNISEVLDELEFRDRNTPRIVKVSRRLAGWLLNLPGSLPRHIRWWWQRRCWGWDERDTWSLDVTIAKFVLPRLRLLRETLHGWPTNEFNPDHGFATFAEWQAAVDKMISAFDYTANRIFYDPCAHKEHEEGLALFAKYYWNLWD